MTVTIRPGDQTRWLFTLVDFYCRECYRASDQDSCSHWWGFSSDWCSAEQPDEQHVLNGRLRLTAFYIQGVCSQCLYCVTERPSGQHLPGSRQTAVHTGRVGQKYSTLHRPAPGGPGHPPQSRSVLCVHVVSHKAWRGSVLLCVHMGQFFCMCMWSVTKPDVGQFSYVCMWSVTKPDVGQFSYVCMWSVTKSNMGQFSFVWMWSVTKPDVCQFFCVCMWSVTKSVVGQFLYDNSFSCTVLSNADTFVVPLVTY